MSRKLSLPSTVKPSKVNRSAKMRLIVTSDRIKTSQKTGKVMVECGHCGKLHELELRQMNEDLLRNQPWCSKCRSKASVKSKRKN